MGSFACARSIFRPKESWVPKIAVKWVNGTKTYTLQDTHLEEYPLFKTFDHDFFYKHMIPTHPISYRMESEKNVAGSVLSEKIELLLQEIYHRKKHFNDFIVIQDKNFNRRKRCGLLVLKFKEHPFILKLFIETPKSFVSVHAKGFEPVCFFYMAGGVNRHMTGFTRVKNLYRVRKKIATSDHWSSFVDTPRKWFWLPKKGPWFEIKGTNIGGKKELRTEIPGIYGIIADAIDAEKELSIMRVEDTRLAMKLCNFLETSIDPHISNFMVEKKSKKLVIVDTEHFPTVVGFKEKEHFSGYSAWYARLSTKCAKDMLFRTKKEQKAAQRQPYNDMQLI